MNRIIRRSRRFDLSYLPVVLLIAAETGFAATPSQPASQQLSSLPLSFEANCGQTDPGVQFISRGAGYALFLTSDSAVFKLHSSRPYSASIASTDSVARMKLAGANPHAQISGVGILPGTVNYLIGNDPHHWTSGAPVYSKVSYKQIYKGIDLIYYGTGRQLEYDFVVAPGADSRQIALEFPGAQPRLERDGSLALTVDGVRLGFRPPAVYQTVAGKHHSIAGRYRLSGNRVQFALGNYDHSRALVIDPVLTYFSYLGGSNNDFVSDAPGYYQFDIPPPQSVAADQAGNLYVTGFTASTDFPVQGAYQAQNRAAPANGTPYVAFVTKLDPTGSRLIYSTYLGGATVGPTKAYAIAVDGSGSAYVTGSTQQVDFPVTSGAYQKLCGFVINGQSNCGGGAQSAFLTKLSPDGASLVYSTFFGPGQDTAYSVAIDSRGQAYIAGYSGDQCASNDPGACFPTTPSAVLPGSIFNGTLQNNTTFNQGSAFVAAFDAAGANLLYSTLYGGLGSTATGSDGRPGNNGATYGAGAAVDASGNFYLVGSSSSNQLPVTSGAFQRYTTVPNGNLARGYVAKFSPVGSQGGSSLIYSTFLGGTDGPHDGSDYIAGIAVDAAGDAYVTGTTRSYDFPVTIGVPTSCNVTNGCQNTGFLAKINPAGSGLVWSTLVGATTNCCSGDVAILAPPRLDVAGNVYVSGRLTGATGFTLVNPLQPPSIFGGVFVSAYNPSGGAITFSTNFYSPATNGNIFPGGIDVDAQGNIYLAGYTTVTDLPVTSGAFKTAPAGNYDVFVAKINTATPSPVVTSGGIVPVYSSVSVVQPGEWVSIYGSNFASGVPLWAGNFPTSLGGASVTIDGKPAYLWYVSPTQINLQIPSNVSTGFVAVVVRTGTGAIGFSGVNVAAFAPSFSLLDSKHVAGIILRSNGSGSNGGGSYDIIGPTGSSLGYPTVAAKAGDIVELFGVGFGPTSPVVPAGAVFSGAAATTNPVTLTINGVAVTPSFAGESSAGLYQINITIPAGLGSGDVSLQASVGGAQTPVATISLQ